MTLATPLAFMSFGFGELMIIGTVALLVFGGQLPEIMRNLGRAYGRFRQGLHEVSRPVREEFRDVRDLSIPNPRLEIENAMQEAAGPLDQTYEPLEEDGEAAPWPTDNADPADGADGAPPEDDAVQPPEEASSEPPTFDGDDDDLVTP